MLNREGYIMKKIFAAVLCCALMLPTIPAFADTQLENVARNTAVTLTTGTASYNNITRINDGNKDGDGASYSGTGVRVLYINLGGMYNVSEIKAYFGHKTEDIEFPEQFTFAYSIDGSTYKDIETVTSNTKREYDKVLTESAQAQYIKFTVPKADASRVIRVREIEVYGTFAGYGTKNLALNKTVTASNSNNGYGMTDGDITVGKGATETSKGAWTYTSSGKHNAVIDLGAVYAIQKINGYFGYTDGTDKPDNGFSIEYSLDNTTYSGLATVAAADVKPDYVLNLSETVNARYVKLIINSAAASRTIRVRELEVYGSPIAITNATQSGGATVTATNQNGLATGLIDGDTSNASGATGTATGAWTYNAVGEHSAIVDLGAVYSINQVKAYFGYKNDGSDKPDNGFSIEYSSDGVTYSNLAKVAAADVPTDYVLNLSETINARYVKLIINKAATTNARTIRVRELEVYGSVNELYYTKAEGDTTTYTICNYSDSLKNVVVIKATYADNALASADLIKIDRFAPGTEQTITADEGETVFIWDGINSMKPIVAR